MSAQYLVSEPVPTVSVGHYARSGIGGAGNKFRVSASSSVSADSTHLRPVKPASSSRKFYSGIGGAGNRHAANERAPISITDEFARQEAREQIPANHVGIGGAGNVSRRASTTGSEDGSDDRRASDDSARSSSSFWGRLSFSRH